MPTGSYGVTLAILFASLQLLNFPSFAALDPDIVSALLRPSRDGSLCRQLITPSGYSCSEHKVETQDGYLLTLQRVSSPSADSLKLARHPPILLQHGLLMAGDAWFLNPKEQSLGFLLADRGFDVWVANVRGTRWSNGHVNLSVRSKAYWDWSWEELALYDLPAMIKYIYQLTDSKIFLVGHSQGTIMSLAAFTQPGVVKMVEAAALLCPITYLEHVNAPFVLRMINIHIDKILVAMGVHQLNFRSNMAVKLLNSLCDGHVDCDDVLSSITGKNCCFNTSKMDYYLEYEPHPSSVKNVNHLCQMIRKGTFAKYDYGMLRNMKVYGSFKPPTFDLSLILESLPLWMAYGGADALADETDVKHTIEELPCKKEVLYVDNYGHVDFLLSERANEDVYESMIEFFNSWEESRSF